MFEFGTHCFPLHFHLHFPSYFSLISFNFKLCFVDQVFDENSKTSEVYETRTKDIVAAAVSGFNGESG